MTTVAYSECDVSTPGLSPPYACPAVLLSSARAVRDNQMVGTQGSRWPSPIILKVVARVHRKRLTLLRTALGIGVQPQNPMLASMMGLQGLTQPSSLDSLFGSAGAILSGGVSGLNKGFWTANRGTDILQLAIAALLGGSQHQPVTLQPAQLP